MASWLMAFSCFILFPLRLVDLPSLLVCVRVRVCVFGCCLN